MKKLKLSRKELHDIYCMYQEDFYDDYINDFFSYNYPSYYKKCEKIVCMRYGIPLRVAHTFSFDDIDWVDSSDYYLDLMYELLTHTNVRQERLVH